MNFGKIPFTCALGAHTETHIYISFALISRKPCIESQVQENTTEKYTRDQQVQEIFIKVHILGALYDIQATP